MDQENGSSKKRAESHTQEKQYTRGSDCVAIKITADDKPFSYWLDKNHYYHYRLKKYYKDVVPEGAKVLVVQCKNGYLLDAVKARHGVGIDTDRAVIDEARAMYPRYCFYVGTVADIAIKDTFEYILLPSVTTECYDLQALLEALKPFCSATTRIIVDNYCYIWEPFLSLAQKVGIKRPAQLKNWLTKDDAEHLLYLTDYQVVTVSSQMLMPIYIPILSTILNTIIIHMPFIHRLALHHMLIARPMFVSRNEDEAVLSVIIPCRNEKGNIEAVVKRVPQLGKHTELIFVEGNSHDGTLQEIERIIQKYPERSISAYVQQGQGKADAVRLGFEHAIGDIIMIFDADLTTLPEELPKFYYALIENKGECINGSRLIYSMESGAMEFLGVIANRFFGKMFSWLFGQKVKDTLCGTKVLWKDDYQTILRHRFLSPIVDPFGDFDMLFGAARLHLKLIDMPVHYKKRVYGTSQIRKFYYVWVLLAMSIIAIKRCKCK